MIRDLLITVLVLMPSVAWAVGRPAPDYAAQNMGVHKSTWHYYEAKEPTCAAPKAQIRVKRAAPPPPAAPKVPKTFLTNPKTKAKVERAAKVRSLKRDGEFAMPTDEELAAASGLKADGSVSNATVPAFTLTLDSFAAWVHETDRIKVGVSLGDERLSSHILGKEHPLTLNLDIAENLVGASLNLVLIPVVRLAIGGGYAYLFDTDEYTVYGVGRIRLW